MHRFLLDDGDGHGFRINTLFCRRLLAGDWLQSYIERNDVIAGKPGCYEGLFAFIKVVVD